MLVLAGFIPARRNILSVSIGVICGQRTLHLDLWAKTLNNMSKSTFLILGSPRSGLNLISQCLKILGLPLLENENLPDAGTINSLLLQDLGLSSYAPAMPQGWLSSEAASKAKDRIAQLIANQSSSPPVDPGRHQDMVKEMVQNDYTLAKRDKLCNDHGFEICNYHE